MSSSLLKRSIELFDDDINNMFKGQEETSKPKKKKKSKDNMSLISTNRLGVKKELKRIKKQHESERKISKEKNITDERHKYIKGDHTHDNLYNISRLDTLDAAGTDTVNKIVEHHKGKLSKNRASEAVKPAEESIFSETDFDKFEKEYDFFK